MPENVSIKFEGGMDRRESASPNRPYELKNARVGAYGAVRAHRQPEQMNDSAPPKEPGGAKPWLRWNGHWFSRFSQGTNLTYTDAGGNTKNTEVLQAFDAHNDVGYMSGRDSRYESVNGVSQYVPHTYTLPSDATSFAASEIQIKPPRLTKIVVDSEQSWNDTDEGVPGDTAVSYLFIPINARGEAGPWGYYSYSPSQGNADSRYVPHFTVNVSSNTSYVEVYRTRNWLVGTGLAAEPPDDLSYYFLDRKSVSAVSGNQILFDDKSYLKHSYSDNEKAKEELPANTLDRKINAWAYENIDYKTTGNEGSSRIYTVDFQGIKHFGAEAVYMDGRGRMIYAGIEWPTKPVQFAMLLRNEPRATNSYTRQFTNEYQGTSTDTVYGHEVSVSNFTSAHPVWQGEQAVVMWTSTGVMKGRFVQSLKGVYVIEQYAAYSGTTDLSGVTQTEWVYESNVALLSEQFRPWEALLEDQFQVPNGHTIRAIEPARLSEEESIATYSMYVFTDQAVFTAKRDDDQVSLRRVNTVGVFKYHVDFLSGDRQEYEYALVVPTKYGTSYIGTDKRVYLLEGRQFKEIDQPVPNIWYSDLGQPAIADQDYNAIYNEYSDVWTTQTTDKDGNTVEYSSLTPFDLGYDQKHDELLVVTFDNIWIFSFDQQAWVGNYKREDVVSVQYLHYHDAMMAHRYVRDQTADVYELLNENGNPIENNSVVTNPILRAPRETKLKELVADYDPLFRENRGDWTSQGDTQITLTDSANKEKSQFRTTGEDDHAPIIVHDGKGSGTNLTTLITSPSTSTDATLSDPLGPAPASPVPVRWFPPMTVRQEVASEYHSVYGNSTFDPEDLVRRTEKVYHTHPRRRKYPGINGSGHIIRLENFKNFKSLSLTVSDSDL